jgi:hypothetical protein
MPVSKHKKRKKHSAKTSLQRSPKTTVMERVKKSGDYELLSEHPDVEKMSQVILNFARPLTDVVTNSDDRGFKTAITTAILIWNVSILPDEEREGFLEEVLDEIKNAYPESRKDFLEIYDALIQRKKKYFQYNKRFIVDFKIGTSKKSRELSVVSTLDPGAIRSVLKLKGFRRSRQKKAFIYLLLVILIVGTLYFLLK